MLAIYCVDAAPTALGQVVHPRQPPALLLAKGRAAEGPSFIDNNVFKQTQEGLFFSFD